MHLGNHLGSVEEHEQRVQHERYVLQWRVMLKGLWGVHTDRDDTDDGTGSKQRMNPLQKEHKKRYNDKMWDYCNILTSWPEDVCSLTGLLIQKMSALSARVSSGPKSVMGWASTLELCFLFSMLGLAVLYRE